MLHLSYCALISFSLHELLSGQPLQWLPLPLKLSITFLIASAMQKHTMARTIMSCISLPIYFRYQNSCAILFTANTITHANTVVYIAVNIAHFHFPLSCFMAANVAIQGK